MPAPVTLRTDFSASELRRLARGSKDAKGGFCRLRQPVPGLAADRQGTTRGNDVVEGLSLRRRPCVLRPARVAPTLSRHGVPRKARGDASYNEGAMSQTVAELLVETLTEIGVRQIFGVVGDALNPFTDAIRRQKSSNGSASAMKRARPWRQPGRSS